MNSNISDNTKRLQSISMDVIYVVKTTEYFLDEIHENLVPLVI